MPAAAVIPALIVYIKVVAVKKLVVETWMFRDGLIFEYYFEASFFGVSFLFI